MPINTFTPNTKILSSLVNGNFSGLADGSLDQVKNSLQLYRQQSAGNFVVSGGTIATSANLSSTIAAMIAIVNGKYVSFGSTIITVAASKDTYVDVKDDGTIVQVAVANGAAAGAITTNSDGTNAMRIAKLISSASAITSSIQGGYDVIIVPTNNSVASTGNPIYPTTPLISLNPKWTGFTYENSWHDHSAFDSGNWGGGQYMKDTLGFVHLRGLVMGGTTATATITHLPSACRPALAGIYPCVTSTGFGQLAVMVDGTIQGFSGNISTAWTSVNGIVFKAEQ